MSRTLAIGDIHGGLRALKQVLERAAVTKDDQLIFLGDYVDGWSESAEVIDFLIELDRTMNCRFIYGNHDEWCHDWLNGKPGDGTWLQHGGKSSIESYERVLPDRGAHRTFFHKMESYFVDEQNRLFVHAGFTSMHGPDREFHKSNFSWDRTLWEMAVATHGNDGIHPDHYPERLKLFKEIYIGHTPTTKLGVEHPWNRVNVWNVDTGAAFMGKLSILDVDTKDFWQSDPVHRLYPNEKGRNK